MYSIYLANKEEAELKNLIDDFISTTAKEFRFLIIEGPAGSGKTETVRYLKNNSKEKKIAYSAPTRQAASNLRLRKINYARTTQKYISDFKSGNLNPSEFNIFVVDEASLLTKQLINELFDATKLNLNLKFLFLGDSGQNLPWDSRSGIQQKFYGLEIKEIIEIYKNFWLKFNNRSIGNDEFRKINLRSNWRLLNKSSSTSKEYVELLTNLRQGSFEGDFDDLLEVNEINEFREKDYISHLINTNHEGLPNSLHKIITRSKLADDTKIQRCIEEIQDSVFWKDNKKLSFEDVFSEDELRKTVIKRFDLKHSRPQMGEIYNQFFSTKKNNVTNVISLFRSNRSVHQANLEIRQHLKHFEDMRPKLKSLMDNELISSSLKDSIPVKGDFLFVAGDDEGFNESLNLKDKTQESIYPGDLVLASSNLRRSEKAKYIMDELFQDENYFFEIEIEPLIYLPENFRQKAVQYIYKQKRLVLVWIGGMVIEDRKEAYKLFREQVKKIEEYISIEKSDLQKEDSKVLQQVLKDLDLTLDDYNNMTGGYSDKIKTGTPKYPWESRSERKFARPKSINGQTIQSINKQVEKIKSKNKENKYDALKELELISNNSILIYYAYALTHRTAQGGEWKNVIIESADIWKQDQNRFLYTALTRSLNKIYLSYIK